MRNVELEREVTSLLRMDGAEVDRIDEDRRRRLLEGAERVAAGLGEDGEDAGAAHRILSGIYRLHVSLPRPGEVSAEDSILLASIRGAIEREFLASEESSLPVDLLGQAPTDPERFRDWFYAHIHEHPAYVHPLYTDFLPRHGSAEDLRYLLVQESTIDAATDDFIALTQVGVTGRPKMEMAENYWDEMGNGEPGAVHSLLFDKALRRFGIGLGELNGKLETEALACGNLQLMLGLRRCHAYKAIGYFAVVEYMAPSRFESLMEAWRRLGLGAEGADYHLVHIDVDQRHAEGWFDNVVLPLVESDPAAVAEITRGAMFRLHTSARYLDRIFPRFPSRREALTH